MCLTIRCRIQLLPVSSIVFQIRMPRTLSKKIRLGGNFQGTKNEFIVEEALYDAIWIANSRRRISRIVSFFLAANRTAVVSIGDTMSFVERERERERASKAWTRSSGNFRFADFFHEWSRYHATILSMKTTADGWRRLLPSDEIDERSRQLGIVYTRHFLWSPKVCC